MTNGVPGALYIMITAVVISVLIMMQFAVPVGNFVNTHPSIQILGLSFLILIGFMLITEVRIYRMHWYLVVMLLQFLKGICILPYRFSPTCKLLNKRPRKRNKTIKKAPIGLFFGYNTT
jgi:predicted tellurium resistance membrane protein TerC